MGGTVSREHARLPFAYTHARKEDHSCNTTSPSWSTRQRIASRLLLLKSPDTTASITPLSSNRLQQQPHPSQPGIVGGEDPSFNHGQGGGADPSFLTLSLGSHTTASEEDDEDAEIVSLSSILIQGPEFEIKWHAVGEDQDFLDDLMYGPVGDTHPPSIPPTTISTATNTANGNHGQTTMAILSSTTAISSSNLLQDTDSGHETCCPHSRSSTLESMQPLSDSRSPSATAATIIARLDILGRPQSAAVATPLPSESETIQGPQSSLACACSPIKSRVGSPSTSRKTSASAGGSAAMDALTNLFFHTRRGSQMNTTAQAAATATTATTVSTAAEITATLPVTTSLTPLSPGHPLSPRHHAAQGRNEGDRTLLYGELIHLDSDRESDRGGHDDASQNHKNNHTSSSTTTLHNNNNKRDSDDSDEEDEDDCDEDYYDLDDEAKTRKMDNRKMDLIAALGIADLPGPEEFEPEPFNFFKGEPIFHQQPDLFIGHPLTTRRYTTDGVMMASGGRRGSGGGGFRVPWGSSQDDFNNVVHLPEDFFERGFHTSSIEEEEEEEGYDSDELEEQSDLDGGGSARPSGEGGRPFAHDPYHDPLELRGRLNRRRRLMKGKGLARSMRHSFSQSTGALVGSTSSPWMMTHGGPLSTAGMMLSAGDEDVAHLSPIPFSELPSLTNIGLCSNGIVKLSTNIRLLTSATSIQV